MKYIVDNVNDEVGWLGAVEVIDNSYWVTDIYLPKQEVNGATCELAPDGMHDLCDWMIKNGHEAKVDKVHFWGHSHVNMGVIPSGQDIEQSLEKLRDFGGTFFIRAICNKNGLMSVAFYDGTNKRVIENLTWYINDGVDRKAIVDTYGPLIKDNVTKLNYVQPVTQGHFDRTWDGENNWKNYGRHGKLSDEFEKGAKKGGGVRRTSVVLKGAAA
jgi:hypothetical protein